MQDEPTDAGDATSADAVEGTTEGTNYTLVLGAAFFLVLLVAGFAWLRQDDDDGGGASSGGDGVAVVPDQWEAVALSDDGRTLQFELWDSGNCDQPDHVELDGDLEPGETVVATAFIRHPVKADGESPDCSTGLELEGVVVEYEASEPIPDGVVFVDGGAQEAGCAEVSQQEVERGSTLPGSDRIDPC